MNTLFYVCQCTGIRKTLCNHSLHIEFLATNEYLVTLVTQEAKSLGIFVKIFGMKEKVC